MVARDFENGRPRSPCLRRLIRGAARGHLRGGLGRRDGERRDEGGSPHSAGTRDVRQADRLAEARAAREEELPATVVKSGPEREDLRARLNGVRIGERFKVDLKRHRRYLEASLVDGLRRGKNTLVVRVKQRDGSYRRARVKFVVAHQKPMVSAGRDLRIAAGSGLVLHGQVSLPQQATAESGGRRPTPGRTRPKSNGASSPPRKRANSNLSRLRSGRSARPQNELSGPRRSRHAESRLHPRRPRHLQAADDRVERVGTSTDEATVNAIPPTPLLTLDTETKAGEGGAQPGIQIGSENLAAPFLRTAGGAKGYSGTIEGIQYKAIWQVVALGRSTMATEVEPDLRHLPDRAERRLVLLPDRRRGRGRPVPGGRAGGRQARRRTQRPQQ